MQRTKFHSRLLILALDITIYIDYSQNALKCDKEKTIFVIIEQNSSN